MTVDPAYSKLVAYGTVVLILYALSKTGLGYRTIYYVLFLSLIGLILFNARSFVALLKPITGG